MRIAINVFPMSNIGGIFTWIHQLRKGFKKLGHKVNLYQLYNSKINDKCSMSIDQKYIKGTRLGYLGDDYHDIMKKKDVIIFANPCPPQNKANKENIGENWVKAYSNCPDKAVVYSVSHDYFWEKNYDWWDLAFPFITHIVSVKTKTYSLMSFWLRNSKWVNKSLRYIPWPLDLRPMRKRHQWKKRANNGLSMSEWKPWKRVPHILQLCPHLDFPVAFHGKGIEYFQYKRGDYWGDFRDSWWKRAMKREGTYHGGFINNVKECYEKYKWAKVCFDLSYSPNMPGVYNYTATECMMFGCVPIMYEQVLESKLITEDNALLLKYKVGEKNRIPKKSLKFKAKKINKFINGNKIDKIRENNYEFVKQFDCVKVAKQYLGES